MEKLIEWWNGVVIWLANLIAEYDFLQALAALEWIDWIVIFGGILGFLYGVKQGIMRMIMEVLETILVIFLVMHIYKKLASFLSSFFGKLGYEWAEPIAFILALSIVWLAVALIDSYLRKLMHTEVIPPLKVLGGAFLGLVHATLLLGLLAQAVLTWPSWGAKKVFEPAGSKFGPPLVQIVPFVYNSITEPDKIFKKKAKS